MSSWTKLANSQVYYPYEAAHYPFDERLRALWMGYEGELDDVHLQIPRFCEQLENLNIAFNKEEKTTLLTDQSSCFHRLFYRDTTPEFKEFKTLYHTFVEQVVLGLFEETEFAVQDFPTFRVQCPNVTALGNNSEFIGDVPACIPTNAVGWHCDAQYDHPEGEINFILPITRMFETNTVFVETAPNSSKYIPVTQEFGQFFHFYGNKCHHFNLPNATQKTRISLDFRIVPLSKLDKNGKCSLTQGKKFELGGYYTYMKK